MTELHPRECLVRLLSNGQIAPAIKARTMDAPTHVQHHATELKPAAQILPEKFVERETITQKQLSTSAEQIQTPEQSFGGVRDLLSMHSSSRMKVNKHKEEQ